MSLSAANGGSSAEDGEVTRSKMGHRKNTQEVLQCQGSALCGCGSVHRAKRASGRVSRGEGWRRIPGWGNWAGGELNTHWLPGCLGRWLFGWMVDGWMDTVIPLKLCL